MRLHRRGLLRQAAVLPIAAAAGSLPRPALAGPSIPAKLWDGFSAPVGMAFDGAGSLYVAE